MVVLVISALLFGVYVRAPDLRQLPNGVTLGLPGGSVEALVETTYITWYVHYYHDS